MPINWEHESADLLVARISGRLARADMEAFQAAVEPVFQSARKIGFLVILEDFVGWEAEKGWADTSFADANDQFLSRLAIVGEERWRDEALMFSLAGLRPVEIQFFASGDETAARAWLAAASV